MTKEQANELIEAGKNPEMQAELRRIQGEKLKKAESEAAASTQKLGDLSPEERAERMQKLLTGRVVPTDHTARYLVNKLRTVLAELDQLGKQMQQHRTAAAQAENRMRELTGLRNGYAQDLEHWDQIEVASAS